MFNQYKLILIAVAIALAFSMGWKVNSWRYDAIEKDRLEQIAELKDKAEQVGRELVKAQQVKQAEQVIVYRTIKKEIPNVTDNRICFADANALSLWNNALNGMSKAATGTTETSSSTNTATDRQIITNAIDNFEQYKQVRNQLNALIDWHEHDEANPTRN